MRIPGCPGDPGRKGCRMALSGIEKLNGCPKFREVWRAMARGAPVT